MRQGHLVFEMRASFADLLERFVKHGELDDGRGLHGRIGVQADRLAGGQILGVHGDFAVVSGGQ